MAQGRMIVNAICMDKRINDLSCDTSRLAFTWLVTFADREGRTYGDPAVLRSMLFPRRDDVSLVDMERYIREWHDCGLVLWYEVNGDKYIWFPTFEKNQVGLRKEREAPSRISEPPRTNSDAGDDELRTDSGPAPTQVKLKEIKEKEVNAADVYKAYEKNIGILTPMIADKIDLAVSDYSAEWCISAIGKAVEQEKRSWAYVNGVLKGFKRDGFNNNHKAKAGAPIVSNPDGSYNV